MGKCCRVVAVFATVAFAVFTVVFSPSIRNGILQHLFYRDSPATPEGVVPHARYFNGGVEQEWARDDWSRWN